MTKARLVPVFFKGRNEDFDRQLTALRGLLSDCAELLLPVPLGGRLPDADAVLFPQLLGEAFRSGPALKKLGLPLLILTSEFGTVNMWDWEIVTFMKAQGFSVFTPYNLELTRLACRGFALRRAMRSAKFLVFQDNPGEGMQAEIFKRFYWWEDACTKAMKDRFGITIVKKSFKELGAKAKGLPDSAAKEVLTRRTVPQQGMGEKSLLSAVKMYLAVKEEIDREGGVVGSGLNCLNESFHSDTTPCLAWDLLYDDRKLIWACEADTLSMLSLYVLHETLQEKVMMSNIYSFLMGKAAIKHEKIDKFPEVTEPENHMLMVHCGYFGVVPRAFASAWTLRPKVLAIVDENAHMMDARLAPGPYTLAKVHPDMDRIQVEPAQLMDYVQYPGSDCRNGALLKVRDGHALMKSWSSHHNCLVGGSRLVEIDVAARAVGIAMERIG